MFPPLEAGCDHQAGEEHALMHRCQILKSKILIQFFIQDARTGETSWNLIVLKPRYYKHMQQEPSPELFLAFAAPSKSLNILSI